MKTKKPGQQHLNFARLSLISQRQGSMILLIILSFFIHGQVNAKDRINSSFGLRISNSITASGQGSAFSPAMFYTHKRNSFIVGAVIQKQNFTLTGAELNYEYTMLDRNSSRGCNIDCLELYSFVMAGYQTDVLFSKYTQKMEGLYDSEVKHDFDNMKMGLIDGYGGFGLRLTFLKNFRWYNAIGIGAYKLMNAPEKMGHNTSGVGLICRTGISYTIGK